MKIVIFGATGQVGKHIITQAIQKNFNVRAFGRNVFELPDQQKNLELIRGTVFDTEDIRNAVSGCHAVISVLNGATDGEDKTRSLGIKNIVAEMKHTGVRRIVSLGGKGVLDHPEGGLLMDDTDYPVKLLPLAKEYRLAWEYLKDSGLDWTYVCPGVIVDSPPTGSFVIAENQVPEPDTNEISSGDLAFFILEELEKNRHLFQRIGINAV
jgi:putative NADH-flavin reductase